MILTGSIIAALAAAYIAYRILFYDSSDFWDGFFFISKCFSRGRRFSPGRYKWPKGGNRPAPEDLEDDSWSSALRFLLFLAVTIATGHYIYSELQKHFG